MYPSTSNDCRMMSIRAYKREADALNAEVEEKRDAVPDPEPVAAAVPEPVAAAEPEPTSYGSYADYGKPSPPIESLWN